ATLAMLGVILGAVYLLWMYQRVCFGEIVHEENKKLPDLSVREYALVTPFLILIFLLGFYPKILTEKTEATMHKYLNNQKTAVEQAKTKKNSGPMMTNQPIPY
ncbi:MAG TPA: Fe-S-binding domain-containing protein, partial [bacterium]|nr:Fe-S-binding domain-containing protein [bacterium]